MDHRKRFWYRTGFHRLCTPTHSGDCKRAGRKRTAEIRISKVNFTVNLYLLGWKYRDSRKGFWQKSVHIHTCCCIAVQDPLYLSPLTTCNRNVETLVQRHSCLRSLTSWAKCLRNAPCQCTAHATARADIGFFKSECFSRTGTFLSTNTKFQIRSRKPDGYRPG